MRKAPPMQSHNEAMERLESVMPAIASGKNRRLAAMGATVRLIDNTPTACLVCGGQLYPRGQYQRFCSKSCRSRRHNTGERSTVQPRKQTHRNQLDRIEAR